MSNIVRRFGRTFIRNRGFLIKYQMIREKLSLELSGTFYCTRRCRGNIPLHGASAARE